MTTRTAGLLFAALTGICWALLAIALRQALHFASTGTIAWIRMLIAFIVLMLFYAIKEPRRLKLLLPTKPLILVAGLGLAINYFAYLRGLEFTSASNAQIMIQMGPLSLLLIGVFYFKERPTRLQTLGLILAGFGFAMFFWDQILLSFKDAERYVLGNFWLFIAAISWAIFAALQKGLKGNWTAQQFNMVIYAICSLALLPLANGGEISGWSPGVWVLMICLGINTLIAYGAFAEALRRIPASHVSVIISANPLLTILLVTTLGGGSIPWIQREVVEWRGITGALLVVSGVVLTVWRKPSPQFKTSGAVASVS